MRYGRVGERLKVCVSYQGVGREPAALETDDRGLLCACEPLPKKQPP